MEQQQHRQGLLQHPPPEQRLLGHRRRRQLVQQRLEINAYQAAVVDNDRAAINAMNVKIPNFYGLHKYTAKPMQQYQLTWAAAG